MQYGAAFFENFLDCNLSAAQVLGMSAQWMKTNQGKMNAKQYYRKWLLRAPLGLVLIGFGACLIAESAMVKFAGAPWQSWVPYGTLALVALNTGVSIFGDAVLQRARYERAIEKEEKQRV